ncbi:MAG: aromatic amino acid transport family protein [Gammaproteobacteria bacterium]|nr:aromatic amino acid transport family protein [Gammaproteobacteria bacterium]
MKAKMLGGILLIVGTTIGGGMLALPIVTAQAGFWGSLFLLVASWMVMTYCAFLLLEVNLWMPSNSNIIFMAKKTLGNTGQLVAWFCYLLLFYCLLAAYISGGSDILHGLIQASGWETSVSVDSILFTLLLGAVVYNGIRSIDYVNRWLMLIKLSAFIFLVLFIVPYIDVSRYSGGEIKYIIPAITVVMTSYGFATIIPSLRAYFNNDFVKLRKVILIGSLIPLICYILWVAAIFGGIPYEGEYSVLSFVHSDHSTLALTQALIHHLQNPWITTLTRIFTSVCVATSFLGVSLCVVDFFADGFKLEKTGKENVLLHLITFIPPLTIALFYPGAFIVGLSYAGVCLAILIIILPALMVWVGRYKNEIKADYRVIGGKLPLVIVMVVALIVIAQGLFWH